ncbi:hypothetical protein D3C77_428150 [compost metagenome]
MRAASEASAAGNPRCSSACSMRRLLAAMTLSGSSSVLAWSAAWASQCMTLGNWSRYRPVAEITASMRGRPSSAAGIASMPITRPAASHCGMKPITASTWASSMPKWRMVSTDQRVKASLVG